MIDGLKPGQRKIIFSLFQRESSSSSSSSKEIKVAQLAGYVSEKASYHHGEQSLTQTIIGMAQNYIGSNNLPLLLPLGQFGTRLLGGKDAASPRYIFTSLNKITRSIFIKEDDFILNYLNDDGLSIEPQFYLPIIPLCLINGCEGIGTGFSTCIPNYNPMDIINNLILLLNNKQINKIHPWYSKYNGKIEFVENENFYYSHGLFEVNSIKNSIEIKELPIHTWSLSYKEYLQSILNDSQSNNQYPLKSFDDYSNDSSVRFILYFKKNSMIDFNDFHFLKKFKLISRINVSNFNLIDYYGNIKKYSSPEEILLDFFSFSFIFLSKKT